MTSLSEKLRALGVRLGSEPELKKTTQRPANEQVKVNLESAFGGKLVSTERGLAFFVETIYPADHIHGIYPISSNNTLRTISRVANEPSLAEMGYEDLAFIDTETSGLNGGTGTYAFMIGVGRFIVGEFVLRMYFMPDPSLEAGMLRALADFLAPCKALVTFNGKAFDAPLLRNRYLLNDEICPFSGFAHLDLLTLSRRLWRARLPSRALKYLENEILGVFRTSEEVPGYEIPWIYFDYLKSGDPEPMRRVFYHNSLDVVSMVTLLNLFNNLLEDPHGEQLSHGQDIIALARVFEELGMWDDAARLYEKGLREQMPEVDFHQAVKRLAVLHKRRGDLELAEALWQSAAEEGHLYAFIELAKLHEHRYKNPTLALSWVERCGTTISSKEMPEYVLSYWQVEIGKRRERLIRKAGANHVDKT